MRQSTLIFSIFFLALSFLSYYIITILQITKIKELVNSENCTYYPGLLGPEDIVNWNNIAIAISDDKSQLWYGKGKIEDVESGGFYAIFPKAREKEGVIKKIEIEGLPEKIKFHPHGIYLYQDKIYAINHAYNRGGERVEIFDIMKKGENVSLKYNDSILFEEKNLFGMFNDLAILNTQEFFISKWIAFPQIEKAMNLPETIWSFIRRNIYGLFLPSTYTYYCVIEKKYDNKTFENFNEANCQKMEATKSKMNNGISYNGGNILAIAHTVEKVIKIFEIVERKEPPLKDLKILREIYIGAGIDNINYDKDTNSFYVAALGRIIDFFLVEKMAKEKGKVYGLGLISGAYRINIDDDYSVETLVEQNHINMISVACKLDKFLVLGGPFEDGISICLI